jgi:hypothetical protein
VRPRLMGTMLRRRADLAITRVAIFSVVSNDEMEDEADGSFVKVAFQLTQREVCVWYVWLAPVFCFRCPLTDDAAAASRVT